MNKFLKRIKRHGKNEKPNFKIKPNVDSEDLQALEEFASCWESLEEMRVKSRRSTMYAWGDQWGDYVRDPDTNNMITEGDLIKKQGKVPLKNNMIAPILNNIEGQFRNAQAKSVCVVRDQREAKIGDMMSLAIEYVHDINEITEVDANTLKTMTTSDVMAQRLEYGVNPANGKRDVWVYNVNPTRVFFNTSIEDARMWDVTHVGEVMDMPLKSVIAEFATSAADEKMIKDIYGGLDGYIHRDSLGLQGTQNKDLTFFSPSRPDMCRVILGWRLETRQALLYTDELTGKWGYVDVKDKHLLDKMNKQRWNEARAMGVEPEDITLIEYEYSNERYWMYRYLTPGGYCLRKGRSPYWHGEHNYVIGLQNFLQGKAYNFVEQFIDQQRAINRTATLIDFIRSASSKGVLVVDDTAFENMTREEIVEEYVRYNGVLFATLNNGRDINGVIKQLSGNATVAGDYELLNLQLKLINEISGVNSAMLGKAPTSGTPSSLYAQQAQNSSLNLKGLFDSMKSFRKKRDTKLMKMVQQFYNSQRYLNIAGSDYSEEAKWYNPEKVQNAEVDVTIVDGNNTPAYQMLANDFLMQLFQAQAIDVKTMLENSSYPFATKILEAIKRNEQAMQEQQAMTQVPLMPAGSEQMAMAMNDANATEEDGQVIRR